MIRPILYALIAINIVTLATQWLMDDFFRPENPKPTIVSYDEGHFETINNDRAPASERNPNSPVLPQTAVMTKWIINKGAKLKVAQNILGPWQQYTQANSEKQALAKAKEQCLDKADDIEGTLRAYRLKANLNTRTQIWTGDCDIKVFAQIK